MIYIQQVRITRPKAILNTILSVIVVLLFPLLCHADTNNYFTLAVHPYLSHDELKKRFSPLAEYLTETVGITFTLRIGKNYRDLIDNIGQDMVDVAYMGPAPYVQMVEGYGKKPILAQLETNYSPFYKGMIVVRADSPFKRIKDLKGHYFAFGDRLSTMSHLLPRLILHEAGVTPENLGGITFVNSHYNVALGVLAGDFDAGALKEGVYQTFRAQGLRALAITPNIPEHLFVARSDMPPATSQKIRHSLKKLAETPLGLMILKTIHNNATGIVDGSDTDYDQLRQLLNKMKSLELTP